MARLIFRNGPYNGRGVTLPANRTIVLGRNRDVELPLPDPKLSRRHCQIVFNGQQVLLTDLNSTNGTFVNGGKVSGELALHAFDRIVIGDLELELIDFEDVERLNAAAAAARTPVAEPAIDLAAVAAPPVAAPAAPRSAPPAREMPADPFSLVDEILPESSGTDVSALIAKAPVVEIDIGDVPFAEGSAPNANAAQDPFAAALQELGLPLPPEPPPLPDEGKPSLAFCDVCNSSIPQLDCDLGLAGERNGRLFCKQCMKNAPPPSAGARFPQPAATIPARPAVASAPPAAPAKSNMDDILAGLDVEAEVIDTTVKRGGHVVEEEDLSKQLEALEKVQQVASGASRPKLRLPTAETQRIIRPNPPMSPVRPTPPVRPVPPPPPPLPTVEDELEEIE